MTQQTQDIKHTIQTVLTEADPVTEQSISDARQQMLKERRELEAQGIQFDPFRDGEILRDRRRK